MDEQQMQVVRWAAATMHQFLVERGSPGQKSFTTFEDVEVKKLFGTKTEQRSIDRHGWDAGMVPEGKPGPRWHPPLPIKVDSDRQIWCASGHPWGHDSARQHFDVDILAGSLMTVIQEHGLMDEWEAWNKPTPEQAIYIGR